MTRPCLDADARPLRQRDAARRRERADGHTVEECRWHHWDALRNGELLDAAEAAGFDILVTTDRNMRYQQNLMHRKIAIVVLGKGRWRLIRNRLPEFAAAVAAATPGSVTEVPIPVD